MGKATEILPPGRESAGASEAAGIAAGTRVMTLDGEIPVEFLSPGDRIVTRDGMRRLVSVSAGVYSGRAMRLAEGALGHDRPQTGITLPAGTSVHLRNWRAKAMSGQPVADAPVSRLFDGQYVTEVTVRALRVYRLEFETPQVIYAEGLELACDAVTATAATPAPHRAAAHA
ncbi:MAG: Hint domain-containing protein [Paracoccaceae bacterium]